jgi:hypothetical protein
MSPVLVVVLSLIVELREGAHVRARPDVEARKRGDVAAGARFEVLERQHGKGCKGDWLRIAHAAWLCSDVTRLARADAVPGGLEAVRVRPGALLPHTYVLGQGVTAYASLEDAAAGANGRKLPGQSGLKLRERAEKDGRTFFKTSQGWVDAAEVKLARPSEQAGIQIADKDAWPIGLVAEDPRGRVYDAGGKPVAVPPSLARGSALYGLGEASVYEVNDVYIDVHVVRMAVRLPRPDGVGPTERWLDVDLAQQVLVAYEGDRPVFATLVSTAQNTPKGLHRVRAKYPHPLLESTDKYPDDLKYRYETPWVMALEGRYALHAVYWHGAFGKKRGMGCVNLAPRDARAVWDFVEPAMPAGWVTAYEVEEEGVRGSVVRVR